MLLNYILVLGGIQGLILSFIVYYKQPRFISNNFLAFFIFLLGLGCLFDNSLDLVSFNTYIVVWAGNSFLFAPILYLCIKYFIEDKPLTCPLAYHFICFLLIKGIVVFSHFQSTYEAESFTFLGTFLNYFLIVYNLLYIGFCFRLFVVNRKKIENHKVFGLIKSLLWVFTLYNVIFFVRRMINQFYQVELASFENYLYVGVAIMIYSISIKIIYQPDLLHRKEKYAKSSLKKWDVEQYGRSIKEYFETQKAFINPEFNLDLLAKEIGLEKHKVSQVLGDYFHASFYDLVNQYRIEEVCKQLLSVSHQKYSILGIAYSCGYQSKSSFNAAFKKLKGVTPSAFIGQYKEKREQR